MCDPPHIVIKNTHYFLMNLLAPAKHATYYYYYIIIKSHTGNTPSQTILVRVQCGIHLQTEASARSVPATTIVKCGSCKFCNFSALVAVALTLACF